MKSNWHFFNLTRSIVHAAALITAFSFYSISILANETDYQVNKIAELNPSQIDSSNWQQLVTDLNNKHQYFAINNTGQMYFIDDLNKSHLILDLSVNQPVEQSSIKLTAIELHPHFSLRDQQGYGTFYTAHLEVIDKQSNTKRIQERGNELVVKFDAVITQWQFNSGAHYNVGLDTKREILRIAVPDNSMSIKQMSFSPYTKSWDENFGLLFVALNGQEKWQKPLYSGVILRINPAKFGLRSFTVPNSNPYLKDAEIKDEIYLLGAQNIKQFIWPDKNTDEILLSHQYKNKFLLSLTSGRDDWREHTPKKIIYQSDSIINDILSYRGRELLNLRNRLLILRKDNQLWQVESLNIKPSINQSALVENEPQQEWQFPPLQLMNDSEVSFSTNRDDEVLVIDKTAGIIFQIFQKGSGIKTPAAQEFVATETQADATNGLFSYFVLFSVIGIVYYWLKRNRFSAKSVVRKQFAHLELSESQLQIGLYHRHQSSTDTIIDIADITRCEAKLNEQAINIINQDANHGFNDAKEQDLRNVLAKEQVDKMIDGKVRQVSLSITDTQGKNYIICLYMRKGSDRITKKKYSTVIDDLIDWCWLIAEKINPNNTTKRKKKPVVESTESTIHSIEKTQTPLHNQAAAIRSATHESAKPFQNQEPKKRSVDITNNSEAVIQSTEKSINTELVNALERLVDLKQQGFLTQAEFTKAKENLMKGLFEK